MNKPDNPRFGQYILLEELGRGTSGVVYKAQDCRFPGLLALKTISSPDGADISLKVARLYRDAQILSNLASTLEANTPSVHEVGEWEGRPYYSREFIDG